MKGREGITSPDLLENKTTLSLPGFPLPGCSSVLRYICWHYSCDGGVPEGGVPDGGVPDGCVPFISIPAGGVPESLVPFNSIPDGGVPCGPADWLKAGLSLLLKAVSGVADKVAVFEFPASAVTAACAWSVDDALAVWPDELLSVHPATSIPAMRIADAISMTKLLFFIEYSPEHRSGT